MKYHAPHMVFSKANDRQIWGLNGVLRKSYNNKVKICLISMLDRLILTALPNLEQPAGETS
jgi:hypothetical protein